jgi:hypothetical protein
MNFKPLNLVFSFSIPPILLRWAACLTPHRSAVQPEQHQYPVASAAKTGCVKNRKP